MKKFIKLFTLLFIALLSFNACTSSNKGNNTTQTENAEIKSMTGDKLLEEQKKGALVIDVRSEKDFTDGHIKDSKNISLETIDKEIEKVEPNKEKKIILYCNTGNKSGKAAKKLIDLGYKDVYNAQGVKQFNYELVKGK